MRLSIVETILLVVLFLGFVLSGCTNKKKAVSWMYTHPGVLAEICANHYPVKTEYLPGKTIVKTDTLINKVDSIYCPEDKNGKVKTIICPPSKTIYTTTTIRDTLVKENTAKLAVLSNDLGKANTTIDTLKKQEQAAEKRFIWSVIAGLCLLIACRKSF